MPQKPAASIENNFTGGLKTEFTGLNFPENACTEADNCVFSLIGEVTRREGIDFEANYALTTFAKTGKAISYYKWNNAGGDGLTQMLVVQIGDALYFYNSSAATPANPLSRQRVTSSAIAMNAFSPAGAPNPNSYECQYADGNGYLFVFHPYLEPFYCTYTNGVVGGFPINVKIRDVTGLQEIGQGPTGDSDRPLSLTDAHLYNLGNQGWTSGGTWGAAQLNSSGNIFTYAIGSKTFVVASGLSATLGQGVQISNLSYDDAFGHPVIHPGVMSGTVTAYSGTSMTVLVTALDTPSYVGLPFVGCAINPVNVGLITEWQTAVGNYPSNADVWWNFKDSTDTFDPATTLANVTLGSGPAPKGFYILSAFNQSRKSASTIASLTDVTTVSRPKTGTWFQGRIWYTGIDASVPASGINPYYSWTENIYFSQVITDVTQIGRCYETNDPTSEDLFALLPTDGGVIHIQGCGSIYKLFPIQNGMIVFAANGIWFITGSQGIGFTANDYTITKISSVRSISSTSFVNVNGLPVFWNEEGIYTIEPAQQGLGLTVNPITVGTILSFYNDIPTSSKRYVRGDYDSINYVIQWTYSSTPETDVDSRYTFDRILNFNTYNKAFYPFSLEGAPDIHGVAYISNPGGTSAPEPMFKYITSTANDIYGDFTFSDEHDTTYVDWRSHDGVGVNYTSDFVTGYKLHGQALRKWQPEYIYVFSRCTVPNAYKIQGIWDYASNGNSGKFSVPQLVTNALANIGMAYRRHRIRGSGLVLQLKFSSVDGQPLDIMGWTMYETGNMGI